MKPDKPLKGPRKCCPEPEPKPKEEPKTVSNRTSEQALKDSREAYLAWCDGKPIEWHESDSVSRWEAYEASLGYPNFASTGLYWRPAQENPHAKPSPPRTPQQAMRDARESGAVEAWEDGKPIEVQVLSDGWKGFEPEFRGTPAFTSGILHWRPKASEPPKPVALDWRPVKGSEPLEDGTSILVWDGEDWLQDTWPPYDAPNDSITHWAPQPLPPEVK